MKTNRPQRISLYIGLALVGLVVLLGRLMEQHYLVKEIAYSDFQQLAADRKVTDLQIGQSTITGRFLDEKDNEPQVFSTNRVDLALAEILSRDNLKFSGEAPPGLLQSALGWILSIAGFLILWFLLMRPAMGQGGYGGILSFGKSKAKIFVEQDIKVRFADVAGVDEAKSELKEIVAFLKDPTRYGRLGAHIPKGILLVGPPGTGKTLLARAVAGEAGVPFFSMSGSEFVELFVGVGAARVRDLFEQARKQAPAIVFIDELDALGRSRSGFVSGGGHDEKEQTLNQLLSELDGFDPSVGVVFLAATNRPEILDPALLRAGRFDRQVLVDRPDKKGRTDILGVHLKKIALSRGVTAADIAALTPGFTGADLANLVNEAAIVATRREASSVGAEDFVQAIERIVAGLEKKNRLLNPHERKIVAYHEMGHALVAMSLPGVDPVQKVSIIPRGIGALGYTIQRPLEDRFLMDQPELMNRLTVLLGGRAAERLAFSQISTGAADDLVKATDIARNMVTRFGMDVRLGQVSYEVDPAPFLNGTNDRAWRPRQYGQLAADAIDNAVRELIDAAFKRATDILKKQLDILDKAASYLLSKETVSAEELKNIIHDYQEPAAQGRKPTFTAASGADAD